MGLVQNTPALKSWFAQNNPGMSDSTLNYYVQQAQASPGANPTEQAGGAACGRTEGAKWRRELWRRGGGSGRDSSGGTGGSGHAVDGPVSGARPIQPATDFDAG